MTKEEKLKAFYAQVALEKLSRLLMWVDTLSVSKPEATISEAKMYMAEYNKITT